MATAGMEWAGLALARVSLGLAGSTGVYGRAAVLGMEWGDSAVAQVLPLTIVVDESAGYRSRLQVGNILDDPALEEAVRAGVPLRLRLQTELWRDGFFNSLEGSEATTFTVFYQPLEQRFMVRTTMPDRTELRGFRSFGAVRAALEGGYTPELGPRRGGRYYYTALLELETLTLSDLAELERWLKGELQPAVSGDGSVPSAVGQGVKRLLVRVLRLPARRYEARSGWFRVG
jgi:hypothetical protein